MRVAAMPAALLVVAVASCADPIQTSPGEPSPPRPVGWSRMQDAPLAGRTGAHVVDVGGSAYVFGGSEVLCPPGADCAGPETPPFADGAVLDTSSGAWQSMAAAPFGFTHASTAVLDGQIYVLPERRLLRYSPENDTWTSLGRLPRGVGSTLVATDHGLLAYAGSEENGEQRDALYRPGVETWTVLPDDPLPQAFDRFAVPDGGRLLVFGSPIGAPDEEVRTKDVAAYDWIDGTWTALPSAPAGGYQAWGIGDRVFLNPHFSSDGGGVLDLRTDTWGPIPVQGSGWDGDAAGVVHGDGAIYEYSAGWVFDARHDTWFEIPERSSEVYDETVAAVGQSLVVFGGQEWEGDDGRLVAETWVWRPPA
jgi:hypothetical protein